MENVQKKYDITSFEDEGFVQECIEAFDEIVANIEKDHTVTSNSYRHDALSGILSPGASYKELRDEYVSEKYEV